MRIEHKFRNHIIHKDTRILVVGTFNPDVKGPIDFFYGGDNDLWLLLPEVFGEVSLKGASLEEKKSFMLHHKIDFVDLIEVLENVADPCKRADIYIDGFVTKGFDVRGLIQSTPSISEVYFTRKGFKKSDNIPNIRALAIQVRDYCAASKIRCAGLTTPGGAWGKNKIPEKLKQWKSTIVAKDLTQLGF